MNALSLPTPMLSPRAIDRLGLVAATACALHCMVAPLALALAPVLGGIWSSPLTHWAFASISVPAALSLVRRTRRIQEVRTRRNLRAVVWTGIAILGLGLLAPGTQWSEAIALSLPYPSWLPALEPAGCTDECCLSVQTAGLNVPLASLLCLTGGLCLSSAHVFTLRTGQCCERACCEEG